MVLEKQTVQAPLGLGIDTKTDPKQVSVNALLSLENGFIQQNGEIRKRFGSDLFGQNVLNSEGTVDQALKLENFNSELVLLNSLNLYSYAASLDKWVNKGVLSIIDASTSPTVANSYEQQMSDLAYINGVTLYAWEDSRGGVRCSVIDQESGASLVNDTLVNEDAIRPRCVAVGQYFFLFCYDTVTEELLSYRIPLSSTEISVAGVAAADINTSSPIYDVCAFGSRLILTYKTTANQLRLAYWLQNNTLGSPTSGVPSPLSIPAENPETCITCLRGESVGGSSVFHVLFFNSSTGLRHVAYYDDFTEYLAAVVLDSTVSPICRNVTAVPVGDQLEFFAEYEAADTIDRFVNRGLLFLVPNSVGDLSVFQRAGGLVSKAYRSDGSTKVHIVYESEQDLQNTFFVLSTNANRGSTVGWGDDWGGPWGGSPVYSVTETKLLVGVAGGHTFRTGGLAGVWAISDTEVLSTASRKTRIVSDNVDTYSLKGVNTVQINFNSSRVGPSAQLGENLHIPGGFLRAYDGVSVVEHGFHFYPDALTVANSVTAGSVANGTYQYIAIYEWIDAKGQIHRSAPSIPVSHTVSGGPKGVDIEVPTLRYTYKRGPERSPPVVSVYRTTAAGTLFYKVSSDTSPLYNDETADSVVFLDTLADASITSRPLLYTTGNVLENVAVASCNLVTTFDNRLFVSGTEQPNEVLFSKQWVKDEGVFFNDFLKIPVSPAGGAISGLATMDDKLIIFKETTQFFLSGEGPNDTGEQNLYRTQQIATDVGCTVPESICLAPVGLFFKSAKGIYLLDRSLATTYVGAPVEEYNGLTVTGGVLVPGFNQVRFTTAEGRTLVYDYYFKQWFTFVGQESVSSNTWDGRFVYVNSDGEVFAENIASYSDAGKVIKTKLVTGWYSFAGLQGFQRVYRALVLGKLIGDHLLSVKLSYDYKEHYAEEFTLDASNGSLYGATSPYGSDPSYGGTTDGVYQYQFSPAQQKCTAIRITMQDFFPDNEPNAGFRVSAFTFQIGSKFGLNKIAGAKNMTST